MYIFVCSPGRSGTKYMSEIFKQCDSFISIHGGEQNFRNIIDSGAYRNNNDNIIIDRIKLLKYKSLQQNKFNIIDTSHIFIHRLVEHIIKMNYIKPLYVINLIRNPIEVAISYTNRNSYPSNNNSLWRIPLTSTNRLLKVNKKLSIFQENLVDWIDTQMKFEKYKNVFDKYYIFNFDNLNNITELTKMFNFFGVNINVNFLETCITNNKLEKNNNKNITKITQVYLKETIELIDYLKTLHNYPAQIIDKHINILIDDAVL
jgi:hypothetical protein